MISTRDREEALHALYPWLKTSSAASRWIMDGTLPDMGAGAFRNAENVAKLIDRHREMAKARADQDALYRVVRLLENEGMHDAAALVRGIIPPVMG